MYSVYYHYAVILTFRPFIDMRECHRVAAVAWNMLRYLSDALKVYVEISRALAGGGGGGGGGRGEYDPHWATFSAKQGAEFFYPSFDGDKEVKDEGGDERRERWR